MSRAEELLALAEAEPVNTEGKYSYAKWMPAVVKLRERNWSFSRIYHWLKEQGEDLPPENTWRSNACKRYQRITKQLTKRAKA